MYQSAQHGVYAESGRGNKAEDERAGTVICAAVVTCGDGSEWERKAEVEEREGQEINEEGF